MLAVIALGIMRGSAVDAVPAIVAVLEDKNTMVRLYAVRRPGADRAEGQRRDQGAGSRPQGRKPICPQGGGAGGLGKIDLDR